VCTPHGAKGGQLALGKKVGERCWLKYYNGQKRLDKGKTDTRGALMMKHCIPKGMYGERKGI